MSIDKIICFGKNYDDHMRELGDKPVEQPVIFLKPPSVLRQVSDWNQELALHLTNEETHYECELVIRISEGGYQMTPQAAQQAIDACTIGLDMTLRKQQAELKKNGHPWTTAKVFPDAAVIGPWINLKDLPNYLEEEFRFILNGELKQKSKGKFMRYAPAELVAYASQHFPLCAGDILFTGTPAGVGAVAKNTKASVEFAGFCYYVRWE
jgi:2-keto-4-pentenoate hydratase/2-oxohepta-3-ene-1,7-dioic acid hydratase in catechol pathway